MNHLKSFVDEISKLAALTFYSGENGRSKYLATKDESTRWPTTHRYFQTMQGQHVLPTLGLAEGVKRPSKMSSDSGSEYVSPKNVSSYISAYEAAGNKRISENSAHLKKLTLANLEEYMGPISSRNSPVMKSSIKYTKVPTGKKDIFGFKRYKSKKEWVYTPVPQTPEQKQYYQEDRDREYLKRKSLIASMPAEHKAVLDFMNKNREKGFTVRY